MIKTINPGRNEKPIDFWDDIIYSKVTDLSGNKINLKLSVMDQEENPRPIVESPVYAKRKKDNFKRPAIIWVPGDGYRQTNNKNKDLGRTHYFAKQGFVVVSVQYRSSAQAKWPAQIIDVKTAIRWVRKHAADYQIDADHIGIMGRSAGSHIAVVAAMNEEQKYIANEYQDFSSSVQACIDLFGPVNIQDLISQDRELIKSPGFRWHKMSDTHEGALLGHDPDHNPQKEWQLGYEASPINFVNANTAPILIMQGDKDPLVPTKVSEELYQKLVEAGLESQSYLYWVKDAGHGTPEIFQDSALQIMSDFYQKYLF